MECVCQCPKKGHKNLGTKRRTGEIEHFNCGNKETGERKIVVKYQLQNVAVCGVCNEKCCR